MIFKDRMEAGKKLAEAVDSYKLQQPLILALPRGGVAVGASLLKNLQKEVNATLDVLLARKIGAPFNEELALGAIVESDPPYVYLNKELIRVLKVEEKYLKEEQEKQWGIILIRKRLYREGKARISAQGKDIVLVDDGVATGATVRAALRCIQNEKPKTLIVAVPVAPADFVEELSREIKDVICLHAPSDFQAVSQFYRYFPQVSDEEVIELLK